MREFKGTKGEWKVLTEFRKVKILNESNQPMFQSDLNCFDDEQGANKYCSHDKIVANAKLTAAAPVMLKELQKIKLDIDLGTISISKSSPIYQGIEKAISKALD